jgi:hypothetical protein
MIHLVVPHFSLFCSFIKWSLALFFRWWVASFTSSYLDSLTWYSFRPSDFTLVSFFFLRNCLIWSECDISLVATSQKQRKKGRTSSFITVELRSDEQIVLARNQPGFSRRRANSNSLCRLCSTSAQSSISHTSPSPFSRIHPLCQTPHQSHNAVQYLY